MSAPAFIDVAELAEAMGWTVRHARRQAPEIEGAMRVGGRWLVPRSFVDPTLCPSTDTDLVVAALDVIRREVRGELAELRAELRTARCQCMSVDGHESIDDPDLAASRSET